MHNFLSAALAVLGGPLCLASCYLLALTVAGFKRRKPSKALPPATRFAVLVPAHNEEAVLPDLLASIDTLNYPRSLFEVYVVADNCTDGTAARGREGGAVVLERQDPLRRGKGFALRWLVERVQGTGIPYQAYVFVDADCTLSPNFLEALDRRFQHGEEAVQGYYVASNPGESPAASLRYLALVLMHHTRPRGREAFGLSCGIFGTGFALSTELLRLEPWSAFTLAEDVEYFLTITRRGVRVAFAEEAIVSSAMPTGLGEARTQNLRWERGRLRMAARYGLGLMASGIARGDRRRFDAGLQQAIPPLTIAAVLSASLLVLSGFAGGWALAVNGIGTVALITHGVLGLAAAGVPRGALRGLLHLPAFALWKLRLYATAFLPSASGWVRTQRTRQ
jgi:cellulose synthase/poly-beta-1,6-N-acetylglucosamine synthase-like glycosyltransferase